MKIFSSILLILIATICRSQALPQLPQVLPPSPEATAITKGAESTVGLFTGTVQASIPLYNMKMSGFPIPVSLSYSSTGLKIDELPSRVGMGWNLSCNGVISRTVHGRPDDGDGVIRKPEPVSSNPPNAPSNDDIRLWYDNVSDPQGYWDSEPDEFSVNAPGLSIKFIIGDNGEIIQIPYSKVKVQIQFVGSSYDKFIITNTNGIVYEFGGTGAIERAISHNLDGHSKYFGNIRTGFFLKKITLTNGDYFTYNYTSFTYTVYSGIGESVTRGTATPNSCSGGTVQCPGPYPDASTYYKKVTTVDYLSLGVSSITSSDGQNAVFEYEAVVGLNSVANTSTDERVKSITITAGDYTRKYNLIYQTPTMTTIGYTLPGQYEGFYNPRFFLTEINYGAPNTPNTEIFRYTLNYRNFNDLPCRLSCAQDYQGYYNGTSNTTMLPAIPNESQYWQPYATADRGFHSINAQKGMLEKIDLPTGGSESFVYEPNTYPVWEEVNSMQTVDVAGSGSSTQSGTWTWVTHESNIFHVSKNQTVAVDFSGGANPGCSVNCTAPSNTLYATVSIRNVTATGSELGEVLRDYGSANFNFSLVPGDYKIVLTVKGLPNAASASLVYDISDGPLPYYDWVNHETGGNRVKEIDAYDPLTNKTTSRFFTYAKKELLKKSSASANFSPLFVQPSLFRKSCTDPQADIACAAFVLSSNSTIPLYFFNDNISYEYVIESNDPFFKNGGTEHTYDIISPVFTELKHGNNVYTVPNKIITSAYGYEIETEAFDKNFQAVQKTTNQYEQNTLYSKSYIAKAVRKTYQPFTGMGATIDVIEPYDRTDYTYSSYWLPLKTATTTEYANGISIQNVVNYFYNNGQGGGEPPFMDPLKVETINSLGATISTENTYPPDHSATAVYQTMVTKNILTPVITATQKNNGNLITKTTTDYKDWFSNGTVLTPEILKFKKGSAVEEPRIKYFAYDIKGNPLEIAKENDVHISYIWDYNKTFPVAEVKNALSSEIFFTSFESDGTGNWSGINTANIITSSSAVTGKKYYNAASFNISTSTVSSAEHTVSYWTSNSYSYTVTGTQGPALALKTLTINGQVWTLFQHKVVSMNISVSGTGMIDELRCYPSSGQMVSYTYFPFVGINSICDANNKIAYYEYDGFSRLTLIRDWDKNILKKICYNFAGQPENCGVTTLYNQTTSGVFNRNNCSCNAVGSAVTYTVPAGTYSSTISQAAANQLAQNDVNQNGQAYANNPANGGTCPPPVIYVKFAYANWYVDVTASYATVLLKFYCDEACTIPVTVANLTVNYRKIKILCNENELITNHSVVCNGTEYSLGTQTMISEGVNLSCYHLDFQVDPGTGYTPINQ